MNGRERFLTALKREEPDRVPIWELIVNEATRTAARGKIDNLLCGQNHCERRRNHLPSP